MGEAMEEAFLTPVALQPMRALLARRADPNARAYAAGVVQVLHPNPTPTPNPYP